MDIKQKHSKEIERLVKDFRKKVDRINNSNNPYYNDRAVRDYEIGKLKSELEASVKEINGQYREEAQELLEQAKRQAAHSYFKPSASDKEFVTTVLDEFTSNVAFAYTDADRAEAFASLEARFEHMTPEQLFAVKSQLPRVLQSASDEFTAKKLRSVNGTLSELRTPEQEALNDAKDIALSSPDMAFRRLKMTHPTFSTEQAGRKVNANHLG
jgi:gluconate kinase